MLNVTDDFFNSYDNIHQIFSTFRIHLSEIGDFSQFEKHGIDVENFKKLTEEFFFNDNYYGIYSDKQNLVTKIASSPMMNQLIDNIERRIKLDKSGKDLYYDDNNHKLMFYFAHEKDISGLIKFLKLAFPEKMKELLNIPFASVFEIEIYKTKDFKSSHNMKHNSDEDNYELKIFFNDANLFSIKFSEFKRKVLAHSFTDKQVNNFCQFGHLQKIKKSESALVLGSISIPETDFRYFAIGLNTILLLAILFLFQAKESDDALTKKIQLAE